MTNEEAIKLIDDRMCFGRGRWSEHHRPVIDECWQAGEMAIKALEQPKTGKWIKTARWRNVYKCDQCGNYLDFSGVNAGRGDANFCPNCGANMEVTE